MHLFLHKCPQSLSSLMLCSFPVTLLSHLKSKMASRSRDGRHLAAQTQQAVKGKPTDNPTWEWIFQVDNNASRSSL